jgi:hypothetical protein
VLDDSRQEIRETREGKVAAEVDEGVDVVLVVGETGEDLAAVEAVLCGAVDGLEALDGSCLFGFGEELGGAGGVGEEEEDDDCEEDGGCAL